MGSGSKDSANRDLLIHVLNFRNLYGSGLTESVPALCESLVEAGGRATLFVNRARPEWRNAAFTLCEIPALKRFEYLGYSPTFRRTLRLQAKQAKVIHCHDMWTIHAIYAASAAKKNKCIYVVSPRGTLSDAARNRSKWKKRLMWLAAQKSNLAFAHCIHATSDAEYQACRELGLTQPIAIIPNGIRLPPTCTNDKPLPPDGRRTLLYFGRIHPIKGLENLVRAWEKVAETLPNWKLCIVGLDENGHKKELEQLAQRVGAKSLEFGDPVFGEKRYELYRNADMYVLPSFSENFGITVAEALACECPVIASQGTPWADVVSHRCGWWVEPSPHALSDAILKACSQSKEELAACGKRGRKWVESDFRWDGIARKMLNLYTWLETNADMPEFVRIG